MNIRNILGKKVIIRRAGEPEQIYPMSVVSLGTDGDKITGIVSVRPFTTEVHSTEYHGGDVVLTMSPDGIWNIEY